MVKIDLVTLTSGPVLSLQWIPIFPTATLVSYGIASESKEIWWDIISSAYHRQMSRGERLNIGGNKREEYQIKWKNIRYSSFKTNKDTYVLTISGFHVFIKHTPTLQWRHYEYDGVSNHQPRDCLLNRLFMHRSKKTSKLCVTGLCAGNSSVRGEFPAQKAGNAEIFPFDDVIMNICTHNMTYGALLFPTGQIYPFTVTSMFPKLSCGCVISCEAPLQGITK